MVCFHNVISLNQCNDFFFVVKKATLNRRDSKPLNCPADKLVGQFNLGFV